MSILARTAVEKNLEVIAKQLQEATTDNSELRALESRLASEKDPYVRTLVEERANRLRKSAKEPSPVQAYRDHLKTLHAQLSAALTTMNGIPWYLERGKKASLKKAAAPAKKRGRKAR